MFKKIKNKYFLLLAFLVIFLFLSANFVLALEVDLGLGDNPTLPQYVVFLYSWGISIAGGLATISFVIGAVGLIISGDNPTLHGNSIDRMKGAILGLVLIAASWIIMNTINPALTTPTLTPLPEVTIPTPPPQPGVYYFLDSGCSGDSSGAITSSQDNIGAPFNGKMGSIRIVNDPENDLYFGVIFHKETGLANGGKCGEPIIHNSGCYSVDAGVSSAADIFMLNKNPGASGDGVSFFSRPFGELTGANAGFYSIPDKEIIIPFLKEDLNKPKTMCFDYTNVDQPNAYKYKCSDSKCGNKSGGKEGVDCSQNACETFQDCPGSIKIKGSYLVALYSSASYCQTFQNVPNGIVPNLKAQPFIASGGEKIDSVYIIATK